MKSTEEMRREYDFSKGLRGKHAQAYRKGHSVKIHKLDGTTTLQFFQLEEGAVMLEPDVQSYFPTSQSVNAALRSLISLIPKKSKKRLKGRMLSSPSEKH